MRFAFLLPLVLLAGCVRTPDHDDLAAAQPVFEPTTFFTGKTEGKAQLKVMFSGARAVHVIGFGRVERDGTLVLDQQVVGAGEKPERREWRIREVAPGRYAGSLSDATGPVSGEVDGNRLHLRFAMKHGMSAEQWLYLQPGGRVALNRMAISKFGVTIAALSETITKRG